MIKTKYLDSGIYYEITIDNESLEFPIKLDKNIVNAKDWDKIQLLEQLWDEGVLVPEDNGYQINTIDLFDIEDAEKNILDIPNSNIDISISEFGNVALEKHKFKYKFFHKGNIAAGLRRKGAVLLGRKQNFLLNKSQWKLIESIDSYIATKDYLHNSKKFAHIKKLAKNANVKIDNDIEKRNFIFAEEVSLGIEQKDESEIAVYPVLDEVDSKFDRDIVDNLDNTIILRDDNTDYRIFLEDDVLEKGNKIKTIPPIRGAQIPEFLDNPYQFIPEEIDINEELFAERVKGLKIIKSRAVPFIDIKSDEKSNNWFEYNSGINIASEDDNDWQLDNYSEFKEKVEKAIEKGESYIYLNDQWIKVNENIKKFLEAKDEADTIISSDKISRENTRRVLDIYDNLSGIEYQEDFTEIKEDIYNPLRTYDTPELFQGVLDVYQVEGYNFLRQQKEARRGSLLADDMGLGKTVQVIALMAHLLETKEIAPLLLVVPTPLIENWVSEIGKFLPNLNDIYIHRGVNRIKDPNFIKNQKLTITSYDTLARDQVQLGMVKWSYIICDETQKIKNFNTLAANAVKGMNAAHRVAMTGTPIENNLSELWSIMDFIQPGLLGSYNHFRDTYEKPLTENPENYNLKNALIEEIKPLFIRRTKKGILSDVLPDKKDEIIKVKMSETQEETYKNIIREVNDNLKKGQHLGGIQKLIEVCSHPAIVNPNSSFTVAEMIKQSPKLEKTLEIIESIRQKNEKVIIFTRYHMMQAILRKVIFETFEVDAKIINGNNGHERMDTINNFNNKEGFNILILSPKSAGVGLNITGANHVIHYTREWNPAIENQATDRVYRRGQEKDVTVYYPIVCNDNFVTVEEKLDALISRKRELMEDIIIVNEVNMEKEFEELFNIN